MHVCYLPATPNFPGHFIRPLFGQNRARPPQLLSASRVQPGAALTTLKVPGCGTWMLAPTRFCVRVRRGTAYLIEF